MKKHKKLLQRILSVVVICVIISSFFCFSASAEDSSDSLVLEGDYIYAFENLGFSFFYYDALLNSSEDLSVDDVFVKFTFKGFHDDFGERLVLYPLDSKFVFESNVRYVFCYTSIPVGFNRLYLNFPSSCSFSVLPDDISEMLGVSSYLDGSNGSFLIRSDSTFSFSFLPSGNYPSFTFCMTSGVPVTAPDTVLPPFKEFVMSLGSFFSSTLDYTKKTFTAISETPALSIFCIGFVVLGFILAWLRKLIVNSS